MSTHDHDKDCPPILRAIREIKEEAHEERKEMREEIRGLRFVINNVEKKVAAIEERTEGLGRLRDNFAALSARTGVWGVIGGGGIHALLKFLGK